MEPAPQQPSPDTETAEDPLNTVRRRAPGAQPRLHGSPLPAAGLIGLGAATGINLRALGGAVSSGRLPHSVLPTGLLPRAHGPQSDALLDPEAFAQEYGFGESHLLAGLPDAGPQGGADTSHDGYASDSDDVTATDPLDTPQEPVPNSPDPADQVAEHENQLDATILSHESEVAKGKQIAETAAAERDAKADDGNDSKKSDDAAAGSGRDILRISQETLETLKNSAQTIADNFDKDGINAAKNRDREAVSGYSNLSGAIRSFYDNWSARRATIVKDVKTYGEWMQNIEEQFDDSETNIAASLAGEKGAFTQDLASQIREEQAAKSNQTPAADPASSQHPLPERTGDVNSAPHSTHQPRLHHTSDNSSGQSTVDILRSIERIDVDGAYANYVAEFMLHSSHFANASDLIATQLAQDIVLSEAITALTELILLAQQSGALPEELGFLTAQAPESTDEGAAR